MACFYAHLAVSLLFSFFVACFHSMHMLGFLSRRVVSIAVFFYFLKLLQCNCQVLGIPEPINPRCGLKRSRSGSSIQPVTILQIFLLCTFHHTKNYLKVSLLCNPLSFLNGSFLHPFPCIKWHTIVKSSAFIDLL